MGNLSDVAAGVTGFVAGMIEDMLLNTCFAAFCCAAAQLARIPVVGLVIAQLIRENVRAGEGVGVSELHNGGFLHGVVLQLNRYGQIRRFKSGFILDTENHSEYVAAHGGSAGVGEDSLCVEGIKVDYEDVLHKPAAGYEFKYILIVIEGN